MEATIIILLIVAAILFVLEIFVPSGGILGLASAGCLIAGVGLLFTISTTAGIVGVAATTIIAPAAIALALRIFPHTPVGKRIILREGKSALGKDVKLDPVRDADPQSLIHAEGQVITTCRPVGICQFQDKRIECLSISGPLDPGTRVKVISVDGIEVKVRPL